MQLHYSGEVEELQEELERILHHGRWRKLKNSNWQCRIIGGPILNFYPSTGRIYVQGKEEKRHILMQHLVDHAAEDVFENVTSNWIISNDTPYNKRTNNPRKSIKLP